MDDVSANKNHDLILPQQLRIVDEVGGLLKTSAGCIQRFHVNHQVMLAPSRATCNSHRNLFSPRPSLLDRPGVDLLLFLLVFSPRRVEVSESPSKNASSSPLDKCRSLVGTLDHLIFLVKKYRYPIFFSTRRFRY